MWQTKSIKFMMDASIERHMVLANVIYSVEIKQNVDQASHMSPLQGCALIVWIGPWFESPKRQKN
jgi:hypothetical protein